MPYTPDWEPLADALRRVIATGVGDTEARTDLCRAVADKKIRVQVTIAASEGRLADAVFSGQRVLVPARLNPNDFDWEQSHPHRPWTVGGSVVGPKSYYDPYRTWERRQIGLIELATADVQRLFGSSPAKPKRQAAAEDSGLKNSIGPQQPTTEEASSGAEQDSGAGAIDVPRRTRAMPPMPKEPGPRREAWKALTQRFPNGMIPDKYTGAELHIIVNRHIEKLPSDALEGRLHQQVSRDTVLRAAGRRK